MKNSKEASGRGTNACSIGFARKSVAMPHVASVCTILHLWKLWKVLWCSRTTSWTCWESIGQMERPSAKRLRSSTKNKALGQTLLADRHWIWSIDHFFLWKAPDVAAWDKQSMEIHLQDNVYTTTPLIMFKTQRCVVLDPRTTNHALQCMMAKGAKCAIRCGMNAQNHIRDLNLYHVWSRGNACTHNAMQTCKHDAMKLVCNSM